MSETERAGEDVEAVLRARARVLARPSKASARDESRDHVVFRLERMRFAIPLDGVVEVYTPRQVTPLPGYARGGAGLTAWRGDLLLVIDIRELLSVAAAPNTNIDRTIVVRTAGVTAGIIVDEVQGIEQIDAGNLKPLPERLAAMRSGVVTGVTDTGAIVLDPEVLLQHLGRGG